MRSAGTKTAGHVARARRRRHRIAAAAGRARRRAVATPPGRARSYKRTAAEDLDVGGSVSAHTAAERCDVGSTTADV